MWISNTSPVCTFVIFFDFKTKYFRGNFLAMLVALHLTPVELRFKTGPHVSDYYKDHHAWGIMMTVTVMETIRMETFNSH